MLFQIYGETAGYQLLGWLLVFVGLILTVTRIFRCQPFCAPGYDPVPEKGLRNRRYQVAPMTKYFYPEEYGLERDENDTQ